MLLFPRPDGRGYALAALRAYGAISVLVQTPVAFGEWLRRHDAVPRRRNERLSHRSLPPGPSQTFRFEAVPLSGRGLAPSIPFLSPPERAARSGRRIPGRFPS